MTKMTGKGSYRGVPFLIEDEQSQNGGRRVVTHEYPLRNDGLTEDLGKRLRHYSVSCLVIGDDHISQAEALVDALEADGVGTVKHPYFGTLEVRVDDYRMRHSTDHQRVTRFDITFLPALDSNAPEIAEDTAYSVLTEYESVLDSLADEFAEMVEDVSGFIESMVDNPLYRLAETTMGFIENVFHWVSNALSNLTSGKTEISKSTLDEMMAAKTNNVSESDILSRQFRNLHEQEIFDALMNKTTFLLKRLVLSTLAVEYGKAISDAVTESVAQKAVTESTVAGLIESKADVQRYITEVDEQLEAVILDNADAEQWKSYQVLEAYRLILLKDLRVRGERLANAVDITLKDTFPAVLLEYQHTGNAVTWKRLALRNGIAHPLFCLGGSTIEVLQ